MNRLRSVNYIENDLLELNDWTYKDNKIKRELKFDSYAQSIDFINVLSKKAEQLNHHPDLVVGYCQITIVFTSHDLGGVTEDCLNMAKYIDSIAPGGKHS